MAGGFDGWLGAAPAGSGGSGTGVQSVVAGTGIGVDNTDPQNPIVSNTGVLSILAGTGVTVDQSTGTVTIGLDATLASLYAFGLGDDPTVDNVLVGSYFNVDFHDDGSVRIDQNVVDVTAGQDHFAIRASRYIHDPWQVQIGEYINQNDTTNLEGSIYNRYWIHKTGGASTNYLVEAYQLQANPNHDEWYDPQIPGGGPLSQWTLALYYTDGSLHSSLFRANSDGALLQSAIPATGVRQMGSRVVDPFNTTNPSDGNSWGSWVNKLSRLNTVLDHYDSGSGHGDAHWDVRLGSIANGGNLANAASIALQVFPQDDTYKSTAGTAGFSFTTAGSVNRLSLSNNTGTYSPIATLADIGPATTPLITQDIVSATQDLKTATTFTVVPNSTGRKFLPIAAYLEIVTATAVATGPTLKLGNNGAHDNTAPALAVANTVAAADAVPFVMASSPAIIDLNTTGIICELTANATGTALTGRVHVIGVYTT